ncbi:MAG TPA: hypothetical protein VNW04_17035 [Puia sp.]|jgi:hypothetical protein|nr:hypothetical protein [Puia sp.]
MKTLPLIATILVIAAVACQKTLPVDPNLRSLLGAPGGPPKNDSTGAKADTSVVPTPPFPQHTIDSVNNANPGSPGSPSNPGSPSSPSNPSTPGSPSTPSTPSNPGTPSAPGNPTTPAVPPVPTGPSCPILPIYGDTLVFPQPSGGDYIINPVNNPGPGKYFSWPVGMVLDQNTGAIDATLSQTGMRYIMGYVRQGTHDTCLSQLILGGASYYDSVYVFANGVTTAPPYFEANPYLPSVCANGGCTFDVTGSAKAQKVIVDKNTGVIDLQKTLNGTLLGLGGAFGLIPVNGQSLVTTITYKINYGSNNALQQIQVQLVYYDSKSLISGGLLGGIVNALDNVLSGNVISTSASPRPPLVIMTRRN